METAVFSTMCSLLFCVVCSQIALTICVSRSSSDPCALWAYIMVFSFFVLSTGYRAGGNDGNRFPSQRCTFLCCSQRSRYSHWPQGKGMVYLGCLTHGTCGQGRFHLLRISSTYEPALGPHENGLGCVSSIVSSGPIDKKAPGSLPWIFDLWSNHLIMESQGSLSTARMSFVYFKLYTQKLEVRLEETFLNRLWPSQFSVLPCFDEQCIYKENVIY